MATFVLYIFIVMLWINAESKIEFEAERETEKKDLLVLTSE